MLRGMSDPNAPATPPGSVTPPGDTSPPLISSPLIVVTVNDPALAADPTLAAYKNELYADGVRRHGGEPALVSKAAPTVERDRLFAAMDALLLTGGADIDPALYGEPLNGATDVDRARDELELAAWRESVRRSLPVFGICRGLQAINVFAGGSLIQDVPSHAGTPYGSGPAHTHVLEVDPAGLIGTSLGGGADVGGVGGVGADRTDRTTGGIAITLTVNTYHHQGIAPDGLAAGLRPNAWSDSEAGRLVEGFEATGDRWIVGIQCHPERTESTPARLEGLWQAFVDAARAGAGR